MISISPELKKLKLNSSNKQNLNKQDKVLFNKIYNKLENTGGILQTESKKVINLVINNKNVKNLIKSINKKNKKFSKELKQAHNIIIKLIKAEIPIGELQNFYKNYLDLKNDYRRAQEEIVEARILFYYLKNNRIPTPREIDADDLEIYIGGLSDAFGEIVRKARLTAIKSKKKQAKKIITNFLKDTEKIYSLISRYSFSNKSGLRPKTEQLKGFIGRLEDMLYELEGKKED